MLQSSLHLPPRKTSLPSHQLLLSRTTPTVQHTMFITTPPLLHKRPPPSRSTCRAPLHLSIPQPFDSAHQRLSALRSQLSSAIQKQNFGRAAELRDEMRQLELSAPDDVSLAFANEAFYSALRSGDSQSMANVWLRADTVSVALPPTGLAVGYDQVLDAWRQAFVSGRPTDIDIDILSVEIRPNLAWMVCKQQVEAVRGKNVIGGMRIATNVFQKARGKWFMVHHHASPVVLPEGMDPDKGAGDDNLPPPPPPLL